MNQTVPVKRALLSVSDKTDLIAFAKHLHGLGVELVSTGGTARALADAGLPVVPIQDVTGFPEMMDGRVKTLHPKVHGGLLALRDDDGHRAAMRDHGIEPIDLLCVNLYPFEQTVAKPGVGDAEAIENIDIGGPSMVRSAAKNHRYVAVVTSPTQYDAVTADLDANGGGTSPELRRRLAAAAFARTAAYDTAISGYLNSPSPDAADLPEAIHLAYTRQATLRYGENPHQRGALYVQSHCPEAGVAHARQLHGKPLSFCNLYDADGALELVKEIDPAKQAAAAVIKHANPCGLATADDLPTAFDRAYAGDPLAAFGGIIALNRPVDDATAQRIVAVDHVLDVVLAPAFDDDALELLRQRWKNTRLLAVGEIAASQRRRPEAAFKQITGGLLVHDRDLAPFEPERWDHVAGPEPDQTALAQMRLAMIAVKHLKSNAVCLVRDHALVGAGAGQMDRLASCRIATEKAGDRAAGAVAASDALFPFRDGPDILIGAGVGAIVEPGGSVRDEQTIQACADAGVSLVFTGQRHFKH